VKYLKEIFNINKDFYEFIIKIIVEYDNKKYNVNYKEAIKLFNELNNKFNYKNFKPFIEWQKSDYTNKKIYDMPYYKLDLLASYKLITHASTQFVLDNIPDDADIILDYAGGIGFTTLLLANNFPDKMFYYFDLQNNFFKFLIKKSKINFKNIKIINKDELKEIKFDCIIMFEFLEHLRDPIKFFKKEIVPMNIKYLYYANGFSKMGLGHFPNYPDENGIYQINKYFSRYFSKFLKKYYYKVCAAWMKKPIFALIKNDTNKKNLDNYKKKNFIKAYTYY